MNLIKKMFLFAILLLSLIVNLNPVNVEAKEAPKNLTLKSKSKLYYYSENKGTDYISGYNFYRKEFTDGTYAYCISNISKDAPAGQSVSLSGEITDKGLVYILANGFPHKSITGNGGKDYYITQAAIWKYFDDTRGSKNWKNTTFSSSSSTMKKAVYYLVEGAKAARNTNATPAESKITYNVDNYNMTLSSDSKYFVSKPVLVTLLNTTGTYTVSLKNAPEGTIIKNQNGEVKTEFNNNESFVIYVPRTSDGAISGSISLTISAKNVTYKFYEYQPSNSKYQNVAPVTKYEEITNLVSEELIFKFKKEVTKVLISKQDITTKEELPGATLEIKDKSGKTVAKWVSTKERHYIEGLKAGDYTLIETIAPKGYVLSKEAIKFTLNENGVTTNVIMYNEREITKLKISKQDITTKEELPGATLEIKDINGKTVAKWVSTDKPHYIEGLKEGEYTLTETIAPEGYVLSKETVKFVLEADGSVKTVVMYNAKETKVTKVKISKQDITTKEEVPGATLEIKDSEGNLIDTWVSTSDPHYIEGLPAGEYTLTETIAPEGYVLSQETITFIVKGDGEITNVVMYNTPYTEVPITDLNVSSKTIIFASILILLGTGMVVYYAKHSK